MKDKFNSFSLLLALLCPFFTTSLKLTDVEYATRQIVVSDKNYDLVALVLSFDSDVYLPLVGPILSQSCNLNGMNSSWIPGKLPDFLQRYYDQQQHNSEYYGNGGSYSSYQSQSSYSSYQSQSSSYSGSSDSQSQSQSSKSDSASNGSQKPTQTFSHQITGTKPPPSTTPFSQSTSNSFSSPSSSSGFSSSSSGFSSSSSSKQSFQFAGPKPTNQLKNQKEMINDLLSFFGSESDSELAELVERASYYGGSSSYSSSYQGGGDGGSNQGPPQLSIELWLQIFNAFQPNKIDQVSWCVYQTYMSYFQLMGLNFFNLTCNAQSVLSPPSFDPSAYQQQNNTAPKLMFLPYTENFVSDLLGLAMNLSDSSHPVNFRSDKFVVVYMDKMTDPLTLEETQMSNVANVSALVEEGKCEFTLLPLFFGNDGEPVNETRFGSSAGGFDNRMKKLEDPFCDYADLVELVTVFEDFIGGIRGSSDIASMELIRNRVSILTSLNTFVGCQRILKDSFISGESTYSRVSKDCVAKKATFEYATDPCCNKTLSDSVCCAPRAVAYPVKTLVSVNDAYVAQTCTVDSSNVASFLGVLADYQAEVGRIADPQKGCIAKTLSNTGISEHDYSLLWTQYSSFVDDCVKAIFGPNSWFSPGNTCYYSTYDSANGPACETDADCYTSCVKQNDDDQSGHCVAPYGDPYPYLQECFIDKINPRVKAALLRNWGVYNSSNAGFGSKFKEMTSKGSCSGPGGCYYNGGWYRVNPYYCNWGQEVPCYQPVAPNATSFDGSGNAVYSDSVYEDVFKNKFYQCWSWNNDPAEYQRQGCFYLPPSESACTKQSSCNWFGQNTWNKDASEYCFIDRLENGGEFCGYDYGNGFNYDISMKGGCSIGNYWGNYGLVPGSAEFNQSVKKCDLSGGKFYMDPLAGHYQQSNCFLQGEYDNSQDCLGKCFTGPNPGLQTACMNKEITNYDVCSTYSNQDKNFWAYIYYRWNPITYASEQFCVIWNANADNCATNKGFTFDVLSKTKAEVNNELSNQCSQDFCYNTKINNTQDCWESGVEWTYQTQTYGDQTYVYKNYVGQKFYGNWQQQLNNGKGACSAQPARKDGSGGANDGINNPFSYGNFCTGLGGDWKFYQGVRWTEGRVDTQPKCEVEGLCDWNPDLRGTDCTDYEFCDNYCPSCMSYSSGSSICVHTNQTICDSDSAQWTFVNNTMQCIYTSTDSTYDSCKTYLGATEINCNSFSTPNGDYNKCAYNPYSSYLTCYSTWQRCPDKNKCVESGYCDDWDLYDQYAQYPDTGAVCILPFSYDDFGRSFCEYKGMSQGGTGVKGGDRGDSATGSNGNYYYGGASMTKLGCAISSSLLPKADCETKGGYITSRSANRAQCQSHDKCWEGSNSKGKFTNKDLTECDKCNGTIKSVYTWKGGNWKDGSFKKGNWKQRKVEPVNKWGLAVDFPKLSQFVSRAIGDVISEVVSTELQCMYGSILGQMETVACACGINSDPTQCLFDRSGTTLTSGSLSCGEGADVSAGSNDITFSDDSVQNCENSTSYSFSRDSSNPSDVTNGTSLVKRSNVVLFRRDESGSAACYAYIQNSYAAMVGQVRGDCLTFSSSNAVSNVELCLALKSTISWDESLYPTDGVAMLTNTDGIKSYVASSFIPYESNGQFCITVSASGTYCPVNLLMNWQTVESRSQPSCNLAQSALEAINTANAKLAGSATSLQISSSMVASVKSGTTFSITVQFWDSSNNIAEDASASVTLTIVSSSGAATTAKVLGVPRVAAKDGIATFNNIAVDLTGNDFQIKASSGSLIPALSTVFAVTPGDAVAVVFKTQPAGAVENEYFIQQPAVAVVDTYGNTVTSRTDTIRMSASAVVSSVAVTQVFKTGAVTFKPAVAGVVSFDAIGLLSLASGVTLQATATGLRSALSQSFNVVPSFGYPVRLAFEVSPSSGYVRSVFTLQPVVKIVDFQNNEVASASGTVSLAVVSDFATGALAGTASLAAIAGQAVFSGLYIDKAGTGYKLVATSTGLASANSPLFTVSGPSALEFVNQPSDTALVAANISSTSTFDISIRVLNVDGSVLQAGSGISVTLAIKSFSGATGAVLQGIKTSVSASGVATFSTLSISSVGDGYVVVASTSGITANSNPFNVVEGVDDSTDDGGKKDDSAGKKVYDAIKNYTGLSGAEIGGISAGVGLLVVLVIVLSVRRRMIAARAKNYQTKGKNVH